MENSIDNLNLPAPTASFTDRLRYLMKLSRHNQGAFARLTDTDPGQLSRILSGKQEPGANFINRLIINLGVSRQWLLNGTDVPFPRPVHSEAPNAGAPVYDIDVTAGCVPLSRMFTQEHIIGWCNLPGVNPEFPLVRVAGDSMYPRISPGSYISLRGVSLESPIFWGQIYVVVLEDYRLVKYIRRHHDPELVILHSDNPDYDDMEVRRSDIVALYMVDTILSCDQVC